MIYSNSSDDSYQATGRSSSKRIFTYKEKEECWQRAPVMIGRDPSRWRLDAMGNPVQKNLKGCGGPLCYEYDHIVPHSKGGHTNINNCQLLQSTVNKVKSNKVELTYNELKKVSPAHIFNENELDAVELAIYGNINKMDLNDQIKLNKANYNPFQETASQTKNQNQN